MPIYYEQTVLSRLDYKSEGRNIAIQQRLYEDDLASALIGTGNFPHLNLPAIAKEDQAVQIGFGQTRARHIIARLMVASEVAGAPLGLLREFEVSPPEEN